MPDKDYQSKRNSILGTLENDFVEADNYSTYAQVQMYEDARNKARKAIDQLVAEERQKEREATVYELLEKFNKAGDEDMNDVRILTNSDSIHEFIASKRNKPSEKEMK